MSSHRRFAINLTGVASAVIASAVVILALAESATGPRLADVSPEPTSNSLLHTASSDASI